MYTLYSKRMYRLCTPPSIPMQHECHWAVLMRAAQNLLGQPVSQATVHSLAVQSMVILFQILTIKNLKLSTEYLSVHFFHKFFLRIIKYTITKQNYTTNKSPNRNSVLLYYAEHDNKI